MIELILGGARSGKSRFAEQTANNYNKSVIYIATAQANDNEMTERIKLHQQRRPKHWKTLECPILLGETIQQNSQSQQALLIDCLTLWLSNLICHPDPELYLAQRQSLFEALQMTQSPIILVSNETGLGVIPMGELTRRFVDESGFLHQEIARIADKVTFMMAGLPQVLKPN